MNIKKKKKKRTETHRIFQQWLKWKLWSWTLTDDEQKNKEPNLFFLFFFEKQNVKEGFEEEDEISIMCIFFLVWKCVFLLWNSCFFEWKEYQSFIVELVQEEIRQENLIELIKFTINKIRLITLIQSTTYRK